MADMKSMLPDMKDLTSIATKLFKDIRKSVNEIVTDYKDKHCASDQSKHSKSSTKMDDKKGKE